MKKRTAEEIRTELRAYGVPFKSNTNKANLVRLLEDHIASITPETNDPDQTSTTNLTFIEMFVVLTMR